MLDIVGFILGLLALVAGSAQCLPEPSAPGMSAAWHRLATPSTTLPARFESPVAEHFTDFCHLVTGGELDSVEYQFEIDPAFLATVQQSKLQGKLAAEDKRPAEFDQGERRAALADMLAMFQASNPASCARQNASAGQGDDEVCFGTLTPSDINRYSHLRHVRVYDTADGYLGSHGYKVRLRVMMRDATTPAHRRRADLTLKYRGNDTLGPQHGQQCASALESFRFARMVQINCKRVTEAKRPGTRGIHSKNSIGVDVHDKHRRRHMAQYRPKVEMDVHAMPTKPLYSVAFSGRVRGLKQDRAIPTSVGRLRRYFTNADRLIGLGCHVPLHASQDYFELVVRGVPLTMGANQLRGDITMKYADFESARTGRGNCTAIELSFKLHRPLRLATHDAALRARDRVVAQHSPWLRQY